ncbi:hypothetical protein BC831DRAFT_469495 [Entophlyctis helioformis]|nr:hypothetical protein BC831DRAFT_469495 [Entophlyctis helioformis]
MSSATNSTPAAVDNSDTVDFSRAIDQNLHYLTFSLMYMGLGLYELFSAIVLLITSRFDTARPAGSNRSAGSGGALLSRGAAAPARPRVTRRYIMAWATVVAVAVFVGLQAVLLDYFVSPYPAPDSFVQRMQGAVFVCTPLTKLLLLYMMLSLVFVFYTRGSAMAISSLIMASVVMLCVMTIAVIGFYSTVHPAVPRKLFAILGSAGFLTNVVEAVLSITCCVGFLYKLSEGFNVTLRQILHEVISDHGGTRFIAIILMRLTTILLMVWFLFDPLNPFARSFAYLPTFIFPLELHAYAALSFRTAKDIVYEHAFTGFSSAQSSSAASTPKNKNHKLPARLQIPGSVA